MLRLSIILSIVSFAIAANFNVINEWKYIDYLWKCKEQKEDAIAKSKYNRTQILPNEAQQVDDGRVFVATPIIFAGVPATLSTVSKKNGPGGPLLKPYPNWEWHENKNCTGMTNVWKFAVDNCNRIWVLDSGWIRGEQVCPPQILVFDLKSNDLVQRNIIPNDILHNNRNNISARLTYPVVETDVTCEKNWIYAVDYEGGGLIVFNGSDFWRRDDEIFHPNQKRLNISIDDGFFVPPNALFSLALTPEESSPPRRLFFRSLGSLHQNSVLINDLHKPKIPKDEICYTTTKGSLPSPVIGQSFSKDGILFFGLVTEMAIGCWNVNTPMDKKNVVIVAQDNKTLQIVASVKIAKCSENQSKEKIMILTNRAYKFSAGTLNFEEFNFRFLSAFVDDLITGTNCQLKKSEEL